MALIDLGIAVEPLALALALAVEQLQALDGAHGLDEESSFPAPCCG